MDWILIWTFVMAAAAVITILGVLFGYLRKTDLNTLNYKHTMLSTRISTLTEELNKKLDEAEFRRFEERHDKAMQAIMDKTDNRIDKLEIKLEEKFDRLFDLLNKK